MSNRRNFYRLLNVQPEAPTAVIQASYRTMMQKCKMHPDLGGDTEIASLLNLAYQTLTDPEKRAEYNKTLSAEQLKSQQSGQSQCVFCGEPYDPKHCRQCGHCHVPLIPAQKILKANSKDKRSLPRLTKSGQLFYVSDPLFPRRAGQCVDLTPTGMRFIAPESLDINTIIKIEAPVLSAAARIAHAEPSSTAKSYLIGVEFITLAFSQAKSHFIDRQV